MKQLRARTPLGVLLVVVLLVLAAACGSSDGGGTSTKKNVDVDVADKIRVTGDAGAKPTITVGAPLKIATTQSWTEKKGTGDLVGAQATVILQLTIANARTGKTTISTFDKGQGPQEVKLPDQLFPAVVKAITGKPAGSRVVTAATADEFGAQGLPQLGLKKGDAGVVVTDIVSTDPTNVLKAPSGTATPAPANAPTLLGSSSKPTGFEVKGLTKPKKLQVFLLRQGTGPTIDGPHRVTTDYLGEVWGGKKPFDQSYSKQPVTFSVGLGKVIPAWDKALSGVKEGARLLIVCPPDTAYGQQSQPNIPAGSTLVFVIDVLGVG